MDLISNPVHSFTPLDWIPKIKYLCPNRKIRITGNNINTLATIAIPMWHTYLLIDIKNGAANRIAQYETGYRTPKAEIVEKIAKVLNVREETFYMPNDTIVDLIRTLIWYDWEHSLPFQDFGDSTQCFLLRIRLSCSHPAVKALLADWQIHRTAFENGRITSSDYLEWMLQWPPTLSAPDD